MLINKIMRKDIIGKLSIAVVLSLAVIFSFPGPSVSFDHGRHHLETAKNIIFMVPDGMGLSNVTATRIFKNGPNGNPLYLETLPVIGYQRTHAANSTVTDSAAAASARACGEKFNNNEVSCHDNNRGRRVWWPPPRSPTRLRPYGEPMCITGIARRPPSSFSFTLYSLPVSVLFSFCPTFTSLTGLSR